MTDDLVKRLRKQISGASQMDRQYERPMSWGEAEALLDRTEELEQALKLLLNLNDNYSPFGGEIYRDRVDAVWDHARNTLTGEKSNDR
jgi:hypothetical protein